MKGRWVAALVLLGASTLHAADPQPLDSIVARVDQTVVTWSQVLQERQLRAWSGEAEGLGDLRAVAQSLVRRRLLVAEAQKMRIEVTPEEVAAEVQAMAGAGGDPRVFGEKAKTIGLRELDLGNRARDVLLTRRYLALRQEMTYVPEVEVRAYYASQPGGFGGRPLFQVRDEVRAVLSKRKYEQELDQWFSRQVSDGRVRFFEIPSGAPGNAPQ